MASFVKTDSGWKARVSYLHNGTRSTANKSGFKTKREAQIWANKKESDVYDGVDLKGGNIPFTEYFVKWYHLYKEPTLSESSKKKYVYTMSIVNSYFSGKKLNKITRPQYQQFLNDYARPAGMPEKSINTVEKVHTQIRASVRDALDEGLIKRDFTARTKITGRPEKARDMKYLDAGDAAKLMQALQSDISLAHITKLMALIALQTGARFSEIVAMTWDNFSYQFKTIRITHAWDTISNQDFKETKNEQSKRLIKITDELADILQNYHQLQTIKFQSLGIENPRHLICLNQYGTVPSDTGANKTLHAVLKRLKCKDITFHGLRHTHASYLIYKGVSIYYISSRLGHANYSTTIRVYSHMLKEMEKIETSKALVALSSMNGSVPSVVPSVVPFSAKNG